MSRQLICCFMACLPKRSAFYALFAQAFITSVRLLCEREVPLTHRLPAICLLEMHREKGSLSVSLRGVTFFASDVRIGSKPEKLKASICFPLFTQQRTSPRYFGMSVSCHKATLRLQHLSQFIVLWDFS